MALQMKGNQNSATEDDLGLLHKLVTKVMTAKLKKWEELIESGADADVIVDMKQLNNVIKWVTDNGIVCADPAEEEESELAKQLKEIRAKNQKMTGTDNIVPFKEEEDYY